MALTQVSTNGIKDATVATADIAADAVTGAKIADDAINSEHYTDGSIDTAHIADLNVTTAKIAADAITGAKIADDAIDSEHLAADSIDAEHYAAGSVDTTALGADAVTGAKIADDAVGAEHIERLDANLQLGDNIRVQFGADDDFSIRHDGSNCQITNTTGSIIISDTTDTMYIQSDVGIRLTDVGGNENFLIANDNGSVELYYDAVKKFETTSTGFRCNDSVNGNFGAGDDLSIYHDGSNSAILNDTGQLTIASDNALNLCSRTGTEYFFRGYTDNQVELYHNNVKKLDTTTTGVRVFGSEGGSAQLQLLADEGDDNDDYWRLMAETDGYFTIENSSSGSWEKSLRADGDGNIELYYNNSKKFETTTDGITVSGHIDLDDANYLKAGTGDDLQIGHDANHSYINHNGTGDLYIQTDAGLFVQQYGTTERLIDANSNGAVKLFYNGGQKFATTSWGAQPNGNFVPTGDDTYDLGASNERWDDVYASNGSINTSDRNEKNTIVDSDLGLSFVNKLKPVSYKFNGKTRTHYGLIAQDIETTLSDISKSTADFGGFIKTDNPEVKYEDWDILPEGKNIGDVRIAAKTTYGLRYDEFIAPLIKAVQELSTEVETLKAKVAALESA